MILLPDGASGHTADWVANIGTHAECLDDDNGDISYVACSTDGRRLTVTYANPSVAEADIASITSVQYLSSGRSTNRRNASVVTISFSAPTLYFADIVSYDSHAFSYETINGDVNTTSDGSNAWTYSDLENLEMRLDKNGTEEVRLSYFVLEVTYIPAAVDNSVFFGTNF